MQLADDMEKCQTVLSALNFTSDLNAIDTLRSIIRRLPDSIRSKWVERSIKIADEGRDTTFADLTKFMTERARVYSSIHGKDFAEDKTASTKPRQQQDSGHSKPHQRKRNVTTLATAVSSESSTAGQSEATTSCTATTASAPQTSDTKRPVCLQCEKIGHYLPRCTKFKRLSLEDKRAAVKKLNLCFCCLRPGHGSADCDKKCPKCDKKHHYHLHEDRVEPKTTEDTKTAAAGVVASSTFKDRGRASLGVLRVRVQSNGKEALCWALVDSGSNTTFIKRSVADELNLTGPDHIFSVNTLGGTTSHDEKCVDFVLVSEDGTESVHVEGAFTIPSLQIQARHDGTTHTAFKHLADLHFPAVNTEIDIVIGTDCTQMFWTHDERHGGVKEPIARKTKLGWILLGPTEQRRSISVNAACVEPLQAAYDKMLMADFEDIKLTQPAMSVDDRRALKTMQDTVHIKDGKFNVGIPWKVDPEEALQNNRSMAESRLRMLKRKFESNPKLAAEYTATVEAYIADKQAMLVEADDLNTQYQWYLPHHAVFKKSNPEKCRVVFDCAAQFKGISLNDAILQGPNYLNNLSGVLMRFRKEPVAVIGDIKLMFHQCFVLPKDRRFLRFLWWPGGDTSLKPQVYCMKVHLFGGKSSPSVVNFCMKRIADDNETQFSDLAINTLRRSFYMDDMIRSVSSEAEANALIPEMQALLQAGGFDLGKFMSTSRSVIEAVPEEKRAKSLQNLGSGRQFSATRVSFGSQVERRRRLLHLLRQSAGQTTHQTRPSRDNSKPLRPSGSRSASASYTQTHPARHVQIGNGVGRPSY